MEEPTAKVRTKQKPDATLLPPDNPTYTPNTPKIGAAVSIPSNLDKRELVGFICQQDCDGKLLAAATEIEAIWLSRNGYPTQENLNRLNAMDDAQLATLSEAGNLAAATTIGKRLVQRGQSDRGLATLYSSALEGSIYSLHALAEVHTDDRRIENRTEAAAYYQLAYLLGDWKATGLSYARLPDLNPFERSLADKRAAELYLNLLKNKQKKGKRVAIWPRPLGLEGDFPHAAK